MKKSPWLVAVERAVRAIPKGQTASYARVALMAGKPGAARAVVQALHRLEGIPWWRVLKSDRTLAPAVAVEQSRRLTREGVKLVRSVKGGRIRLAQRMVSMACGSSSRISALTSSRSTRGRARPLQAAP